MSAILKNKIISSKKFILITSFVILILLSVALNITFSSFTKRSENVVTNIKIKDMEYGMTINGISKTTLTIAGNKTTTANIVINSLNNIDSKYELIYQVCSDSSCTTFINKPVNLTIEYSSKTIDSISGVITSNGSKQIRVAVTNTSATVYYIKLNINAGYTHNTLVLQDLITTEYNEEDVKIAALINGELSTTFPVTEGFDTIVECQTNGGASNATGTATWNGNKWVVNIMGADSGQTVCNVKFTTKIYYLKNQILGPNNSNAVSDTSINFAEISSDVNGKGLYYTSNTAYTQDSGVSYYFRGAVTNNWVKFGKNSSGVDLYWRIVRIDEFENIKLIYNGTVAVQTGATTSTFYSEFAGDEVYNDNAYTGYMYGISPQSGNYISSNSTSYNQAHTNTYSSMAKEEIDGWFNSHFKSYRKYLAEDAIYCSDRSLSSGTGYGLSPTNYGAYARWFSTKRPTYKCINTNDQFTSTLSSKGNKKLNYPVGLITADEVMFAGGGYAINTSYYLYTNQDYWTMTPNQVMWSDYDAGGYIEDYTFAKEFTVHSNGILYSRAVSLTPENNDIAAIRPVISLKSDVQWKSGIGTVASPYEIILN